MQTVSPFANTAFDADTLLQAQTSTGASQAPRAAARLVEYARDHWLALPPHTTLEILENPTVVAVPGTPYYAYGLMQWQQDWIPLIHLDSLIRAFSAIGTLPPARYALVVAYQRQPGAPVQHAAVALLSDLPHATEVTDDQACPLPTDSDIWPAIALSCFMHEGRAIPILDTARLFGTCHG